MDLMPVCDFRLLLDYLNVVSLQFGALAVLETGIVLYLYHQEAESWAELLVPDQIRGIFGKMLKKMEREDKDHSKRSQLRELLTRQNSSEKVKMLRSSQTMAIFEQKVEMAQQARNEHDTRIRKQLYRQLFFVL